MASEKCVTPKNVEPFGNPNGAEIPNNQKNFKNIVVYSGGTVIKTCRGILEEVSPNHVRITQRDYKTVDVYNATIIVSD